MVFQRANVELTAGTIIVCVTKKNIACSLHHLLAFYNPSALMPVVREPAAEPFQYGSLGLFKLKEEGFVVASHQQCNKAEGPDRTDTNRFKGKVYYFMPVENMTPISTQAVAVEGKNALSIESMAGVRIRMEVKDRWRSVSNS
jgi:hypothetical protein